jgi:hypothetical protein
MSALVLQYQCFTHFLLLYSGATLLRKMDEAKDEHKAHASAFEELNGALEPEITAAWRAEVEHWEENPNDLSVPNPFDAKVSSKSSIYKGFYNA